MVLSRRAVGVSLLLLSSFISLSWTLDPCYDIQNPNYNNTGNCVPRTSCTSGVFTPGACPSAPVDHLCCFDQKFPGREVRGAWIASVANIDWPTSRTDSVGKQIDDLKNFIDILKYAGFNAVYFQVRPHGDALYNSAIEPWSEYMSGTQGQAPNPFWDPLQYIIDYAHAVDIEVHAWINPYRANMKASSDGLAPNHIAIQHPEFAYPYSTFLWMDPGSEIVQNRTFAVVMDLVTRYDLDGLHMDDYFYPYPVTGIDFPDDETYSNYLEYGGTMNLEDWRRDNVNRLVERLNIGIHSEKPWVKFSISPFGIYRPGHPEGMPPPIAGFDQYSQIYCDPKLWLQQGWVDALIPQLYWKIEPPAQSYPLLLEWWVAQNNLGRHVYAGNYLSRVLTDGWPLIELENQIMISRENKYRQRGSWGNVQFSAKVFRDNNLGSIEVFRRGVYRYPALQPSFPWLASNQPLPKPLEIKMAKNLLSWDNLEEAIHKIVIYKEVEGEWQVNKILPKTNTRIELTDGVYAVAAVDRFGRESEKRFIQV